MRSLHGIILLLSVLIALLCQDEATAQTARGNELLRKLSQNFVSLDTMILGAGHQGSDMPTVRDVSRVDVVREGLQHLDSALSKRTVAQIGELMSETGLELTGQTYYRLDEGLGFDDEDAVSRYRGKVQAEVNWNFFKSSLYNRAGRVDELMIKEEIDRKRYMKEDLGLFVARQKESFRDFYDSQLRSILVHHIYNLSLLSDAQEYLLDNEQVSSDELMDILNEKAEAERLFVSAGGDGQSRGVTDLSTPVGAVVYVDTLALFNMIRKTQYDMNVLDLRMKYLDRQAANTSYWNELTLAPFLRYSYYARSGSGVSNSSNVDVGLSFRFPLSNGVHHKKKSIRAEQCLLEAEKERVEDKVLETARLIVNDIVRHNRSIQGELQRLRKQKDYIAMRVNAYNHSQGHYDMLARAKEYNKYFECWERLLAFQYSRDCLIADLQVFLTESSVLDYCHEIQL